MKKLDVVLLPAEVCWQHHPLDILWHTLPTGDHIQYCRTCSLADSIGLPVDLLRESMQDNLDAEKEEDG